MKRIFFSLIVLVLVLLSGFSEEPDPIVLNGSRTYSTSGKLAVLEDPERLLYFNDILAKSSIFRVAEVPVPNLGFTKGAVWVYFRVRNSGIDSEQVLVSFEYPVADRVEFYLPKKYGGFHTYLTGDSVPSPDRGFPSGNFVYPLTVEPGTELPCYIRILSTAGMSIPVHLYSAEGFSQANLRNLLLYGALFGILFLVLVYVASAGRRLYHGLCPWFCLYCAFFGLHTAVRGGFIRLLLGAGLYFLNNPLNILGIGLLFFTGTKFYRQFLELDKTAKFADKIMMVLQYGSLLFIPLSFFPNPVAPLVSLSVFVMGPIFSSGLAFFLWLKGNATAGYFALGWIAAHLVSLSDTLRVYGALPYHPYSEAAIPVSLFIALLFFSAAVIRKNTTEQLLAWQDPLTELANRRKADETLEGEWNRCLRAKVPMSVIMVDVDYFKQYNDSYGHKAGDACLQVIAKILQSYTRRAGDLAVRFGGEEFLMILPNMEREKAVELAEALRKSVDGVDLPEGLFCRIPSKLTISLGVAGGIPTKDGSPASFISAADAALYEAKRRGRNRTVEAS